MPVTPGTARLLAGIVALSAWTGLAVQLFVSFGETGSIPRALWVMIRYFTIITNLLVAILFTSMALGRRGYASPMLVGGITLAILLVGVVYALLLSHLYDLTGAAKLADVLLHTVTPMMALVFWLAAGPRGVLRWRDPLIWILLPLAYFGYALVRGGVERIYAYPFIDIGQIGPFRTVVNAIAIAAAFVVAGLLMVLLDRRLNR